MFFEKSDFANFVTERHVCLCAKSFKNQTSSSFSIEIRETNITLESQKSSVRSKFQTSSIHLHVYTHLSYSLISVERQFSIFFPCFVICGSIYSLYLQFSKCFQKYSLSWYDNNFILTASSYCWKYRVYTSLEFWYWLKIHL